MSKKSFVYLVTTIISVVVIFDLIALSSYILKRKPLLSFETEVRAYCPCNICTNGDYITASGSVVGPMGIASSIFDFGTVVKVPGYGKAKVNIVFCGATGTGKTTTLNVLSRHIPSHERIITIEDTPELRLMQDHVVSLQSKQSNVEGKGAISIRDLFVNSLRMRPDRIIIGEVRSDEMLDLIESISRTRKFVL